MFVLGIGFELDQDRSALALVEARGGNNNLHHLEHPPLGPGHTHTVKRILEIAASLPRCSPLVDVAGPGRSIIDQLREGDLHPMGVAVTDGGRVRYEHGFYQVPIEKLAGGLQTSMERGLLKIDQGLPGAHAISLAVTEFGFETSRRGNDGDKAVGEHGDGVLAIALAVWWLGFIDSEDYRLHSSR